MDRSQSPIVRAVDIGYGHTKFTISDLEEDGNVQSQCFPSLAPGGYSGLNIGVGDAARARVVPIEADGQTFSVGPEALLAAGGNFRRLIEESFFESPQYLALLRGALHFMNLPANSTIDYLVVGLPLNAYRDESKRKSVMARFTGQHALPDRGGAKNTMLVREVILVPQAMGALLAQAKAQGRAERLSAETHLTIDCGYGTLLWMVSAGLTPMVARCGETMGGISTILQGMVSDLDPSLVNVPMILDRFDRAVREPDYELRVRGEAVDVQRFRGRMQAELGEHLGVLLRALGNASDIDNIFLCGGGAPRYLPLVQQAFPTHKIQVDETHCRFQNVRGYQLIGARRALLDMQSSLARAA